MLKHMLLGLGAASLLVVVTAMPVQATHLNGAPLPQPLIVPGNNGAWEWAWVGPCTDDLEGRKCSFGTENYGFAAPVSDAQWTNSFTDLPDLIGAFIDFNNLTTKCAAAYFNQETHLCNTGDFNQGVIWQSPFPSLVTDGTLGVDPTQHPGAEVLWVRARVGPGPDPNGSVPEPSSLLLLGAGLLGLAAWRWKQTA
jgi:hypothetical protein